MAAGHGGALPGLGLAVVLAALLGASLRWGPGGPAAAGLAAPRCALPPALPARGLRGCVRPALTGGSWAGGGEARRLAGAHREAGAGGEVEAGGAVRAGAVVAALAAAAGAFGSIYTPVAGALFRSPLYELLFFTFAACTALWFLSPSALAAKVYGMLRPLALKSAARGEHRRAAVGFAACHLASAATSAGQAFLAACLVVQALPQEARYALVGIPANAAWLAGPGVRGFLGEWLAPLGPVAAWSTQVLAVLIRRKTSLLFAAFLAPQAARFLLAATAPTVQVSGKTGQGFAAEALRTVAAAAALAAGLVSGLHAVGTPMPPLYGVIGAAVLAAAPLTRDIAARLLAAAKKLPGENSVVRGHVGGQFVSGRLTGFSGRSAEVQLSDGTSARMGAWTALELLRQDRTGGQVVVPAAGLGASLQEAEKLLTPKKKVLPKLVALVATLAVLAMWPSGARVAYAFGLSVYLGRLILPRMLVLAVTATTALSLGPASCSTAYAFGAGFLLCSIFYPTPRPGPIAACTGLDLAAGEATVAWRAAGARDEDSVAEKLKAAAEAGASGKQADVGLIKERKVAKVKVIVSALMLTFCCFFGPAVHQLEAATMGNMALRFGVCGVAAAVLLRLMLAGVMAQGFRQVLPQPLARLGYAPASVASWFLAVNARAALVGAVMGLLLPMQGFIQGFVYRHGVIHQIHFIDAWLLQISTGALLAVLGVQATRLLLLAMPARPTGELGRLALPAGRAAVCAFSALVLWHVVFLAIPGAAIPGGSALGAAVATAAVIGGAPGLLRDWAARLWLALSGAPRPGEAVCVRGEEAAVPGRLLRFEGRSAVVRLHGGEEKTIGAALLLGAARAGVRSVGARIPVEGSEEDASHVASALRTALDRQAPILHRGPFAPTASTDEDGALQLRAFVDRSLPPDEAWKLRSSLLLEAARAARPAEEVVAKEA